MEMSLFALQVTLLFLIWLASNYHVVAQPPRPVRPPPPPSPPPPPPRSPPPPPRSPPPPPPSPPPPSPPPPSPPPPSPPPPSPPPPSPPPPSPPPPSPPPPSPPPPSPPPPSPSPPPPSPPPPSPPPPSPPPPSPPPPSPPPPSPPPPSPPPPSPPPPSPPPPSPPPPPAPIVPPPPPSRLPRMVRCRDPSFPSCYNVWLPCPSTCPYSCLAECVTCRPVCSCTTPGSVCMDPKFVGGDGITFYFHGRKDQDFCLVSDSNLHINAHFIGKRKPTLTRDFTWVQTIGLMFDSHKLLVGAKKTSTWDESNDHLMISLDGALIFLPTRESSIWRSPDKDITIRRTRPTNGIVVNVSNNFKVTAIVVPITKEESRVHSYNITDDDCFAHLELGFKFYNLGDEVDGVLGQTYRRNYVSKTKVNVPMPVMGGQENYTSSGIFATDCAVSQFGRNRNALRNGKPVAFHYPSMQCSSGMNGEGVVCRR